MGFQWTLKIIDWIFLFVFFSNFSGWKCQIPWNRPLWAITTWKYRIVLWWKAFYTWRAICRIDKLAMLLFPRQVPGTGDNERIWWGDTCSHYKCKSHVHRKTQTSRTINLSSITFLYAATDGFHAVFFHFSVSLNNRVRL